MTWDTRIACLKKKIRETEKFNREYYKRKGEEYEQFEEQSELQRPIIETLEAIEGQKEKLAIEHNDRSLNELLAIKENMMNLKELSSIRDVLLEIRDRVSDEDSLIAITDKISSIESLLGRNEIAKIPGTSQTNQASLPFATNTFQMEFNTVKGHRDTITAKPRKIEIKNDNGVSTVYYGININNKK